MNSDLGLSSFIDILNSALLSFACWDAEFWTKIVMFYLTDRIQHLFYLLCFCFLLFILFAASTLIVNRCCGITPSKEKIKGVWRPIEAFKAIPWERDTYRRDGEPEGGQLGIWRPFRFRLWDQIAWQGPELVNGVCYASSTWCNLQVATDRGLSWIIVCRPCGRGLALGQGLN